MSLEESINAFLKHCEKLKVQNRFGETKFEEEFKKLVLATKNQRTSVPATQGQMKCNEHKNRYKDILPYDATRVVLDEILQQPGSDYINANFIKDPRGVQTYIAAQGPLPATVVDFWRMIWKYQVRVVIMACNEMEGDSAKKKCHRYWPNEGEEVIHRDIKVTLVEEQRTGFCVVRVLQAHFKEDVRLVYHFHYEAWQDHGSPTEVLAVLNMLAMARFYHEQGQEAPIIVNCSAGCGRTGTIIALDYCWSLVKLGMLTSDFDIFKLLIEMRAQRPSLVQSADQYEFLHNSVEVLFRRYLEMMEDHAYENFETPVGNRNSGDGNNIVARSSESSLPSPPPRPARCPHLISGNISATDRAIADNLRILQDSNVSIYGNVDNLADKTNTTTVTGLSRPVVKPKPSSRSSTSSVSSTDTSDREQSSALRKPPSKASLNTTQAEEQNTVLPARTAERLPPGNLPVANSSASSSNDGPPLPNRGSKPAINNSPLPSRSEQSTSNAKSSPPLPSRGSDSSLKSSPILSRLEQSGSNAKSSPPLPSRGRVASLDDSQKVEDSTGKPLPSEDKSLATGSSLPNRRVLVSSVNNAILPVDSKSVITRQIPKTEQVKLQASNSGQATNPKNSDYEDIDLQGDYEYIETGKQKPSQNQSSPRTNSTSQSTDTKPTLPTRNAGLVNKQQDYEDLDKPVDAESGDEEMDYVYVDENPTNKWSLQPIALGHQGPNGEILKPVPSKSRRDEDDDESTDDEGNAPDLPPRFYKPRGSDDSTTSSNVPQNAPFAKLKEKANFGNFKQKFKGMLQSDTTKTTVKPCTSATFNFQPAEVYLKGRNISFGYRLEAPRGPREPKVNR